MKKEVIEVRHEFNPEEPADNKEITFEYGGYTVRVTLPKKPDTYSGPSIEILSEGTKEGFWLWFKNRGNEFVMSIDGDGGRTETKYRTYKEWLNTERTETALKIIGDVLNRK